MSEISKFVAQLCTGNVLDLGCGDGVLASYYGGTYLGVDFSQTVIDVARKNHPDRAFVCADFLTDPLPEGPWDTIVLGEVMEHLDNHAEAVLLGKIERALSPNGHVVVTVPRGDAVPNPAHCRSFNEKGLQNRLESLGSVVIHRYRERYLVASAHPARPKLSVVLIAKNEEELLGQCLDSLCELWDELVVVDTGSTDATVEIARSFGARIGTFPWIDDFAAARNYAESLCFGEYVYWQDADEVLIDGADAIREDIQNDLDGIAPFMVFTRDAVGVSASTHDRQELLHKNNGQWTWHGAAHNWLAGPTRYVDRRIVVEHLNRPSGDRPNHQDIFDALRKNFTDDGMTERNLFYLAREHFYARHYQETLGLVSMLLAQPRGWPEQRARAAVIAGDCWRALGNVENAADAYIRGASECASVAEPFYSIGRLRYEQRKFGEAAAWLAASCVPEPGGYFVDRSIYDWRRYDLLAVCLSKIGRNEEARKWGEKALAARPDDERLKKNMEYYQ